jgi:hypothetical protein
VRREKISRAGLIKCAPALVGGRQSGRGRADLFSSSCRCRRVSMASASKQTNRRSSRPELDPASNGGAPTWRRRSVWLAAARRGRKLIAGQSVGLGRQPGDRRRGAEIVFALDLRVSVLFSSFRAGPPKWRRFGCFLAPTHPHTHTHTDRPTRQLNNGLVRERRPMLVWACGQRVDINRLAAPDGMACAAPAGGGARPSVSCVAMESIFPFRS